MFVLNYLTVLVFTKTIIHPSVAIWAIISCSPNMVTVRVCSKLKTSWKSVVFTNKVGKNFRYFVGVFNKTIIPPALVGYISYPTRTRGIIVKYYGEIPRRTWLPPQYAKRWVLKFRLGTYVPLTPSKRASDMWRTRSQATITRLEQLPMVSASYFKKLRYLSYYIVYRGLFRPKRDVPLKRVLF